MRVKNSQRGDTIIEVILAGTILALVTVSMFSVMQRGTASSYDALERSQVRLELNRQGEMLNYFRDEYTKASITGATMAADDPGTNWQTIVNTAGPYVASATPTLSTCAPSSQAFFVRFDTATSKYLLYPESSYAAASGLPSAGEGIWVEQVNPSGFAGLNRKFHDFYIMACWQTTTSQTQTMSSIVRMYDPAQ